MENRMSMVNEEEYKVQTSLSFLLGQISCWSEEERLEMAWRLDVDDAREEIWTDEPEEMNVFRYLYEALPDIIQRDVLTDLRGQGLTSDVKQAIKSHDHTLLDRLPHITAQVFHYALVVAMTQKDHRTVTHLARRIHPGAWDPNDPFMEPAIHLAVRNNMTSVLDELLTKPNAVAVRDSKGYSPLHAAAAENNVAVMPRLIQAGCVVDDLTFQFRTPLLIAIRPGGLEAVRLLLNAGANINGLSLGIPPVIEAACDGEPAIMELLLARGADAHIHVDGKSPLYGAAALGRTEIILMLLAAGVLATEADYNIAVQKTQGDAEVLIARAILNNNQIDDQPLLLKRRM
jgi:hypothetical protein